MNLADTLAAWTHLPPMVVAILVVVAIPAAVVTLGLRALRGGWFWNTPPK